jgi:hypothetical protein
MIFVSFEQPMAPGPDAYRQELIDEVKSLVVAFVKQNI